MLKLLKYEFRKAQSAFLTLLGLTAALELYFLYALYQRKEDHMAISMVLLVLCAYAVAIFVFVRGVTSYSGELKSKSSYLIFLTPNSTLKIMGSKYLYTFVNGLFFAALFAVLAGFDFLLGLQRFGEYEDFLEGMQALLRMNGVYVDQILYGVLFIVAYAFLSILSTIAVAYFAITIGHTLFRDKKWRWVPSLVLFFALVWAINWICGQFPSAWDELVMIDPTRSATSTEVTVQVTADAFQKVIIPSLLPTAGVSVVTIVASLFGCSALLEHKVSL